MSLPLVGLPLELESAFILQKHVLVVCLDAFQPIPGSFGPGTPLQLPPTLAADSPSVKSMLHSNVYSPAKFLGKTIQMTVFLWAAKGIYSC